MMYLSFVAPRMASLVGRHRAHLAHPHHFQLGRQLPHLRPQMNRYYVVVVVVVKIYE